MAYQFSTTPLYVRQGDTVEFRYKAPDSWDTTETVAIKFGKLTAFWYITTMEEDFQPDPFPLQGIRNAELNTEYTYADGTRAGETAIIISGLTPGTQAPVTISANDSPENGRYFISINGSPFTTKIQDQPITTVKNGDVIRLRAISFSASSRRLRISLTVGLATEEWVITTKTLAINSPNPAPEFFPLTGLPVNFPVYSNVVLIQGLNSPAKVSAGFGTLIGVSNTNVTSTNADGYEVLIGTAFTSGPTVNNGQYIQLLATSSTNPFTTVPISVDIGEGIGVSDWFITTGEAISYTPNDFIFPNVLNVPPNRGIESESRPISGISGLTDGISVKVDLVSTNGAEARIKINDSSFGLFPTYVENGDVITLYNKSSPNFGGTVETLIKVGTRVITTWSIDTYDTPDSTPEFNIPPNLTNKVPDTYYSSAIIGITDINIPITINATNGALISIDYGDFVTGPVTFDPIDNKFIIISLKSSNTLSGTVSTTVTIGGSAPFVWSVTTYAVAPVTSPQLGTWYSIKTKKYDGFSIGTVVQVLKENVVAEYGNLQERFPGFLECDGSTYFTFEYPELWNVIGNTYGGNGNFDESTGEYTGTFKVPDYRNKRLCGIGPVDGNSGGSAFLPVSSGSINQPGSTGGYWYIDKVGIGGPLPLEQVYTGDVESPFFTLGTVKTTGTETMVGEANFTVNGSISALIPEMSEVIVNVPPHEHIYWSSRTESDDGEPLIPWGAMAAYGHTANTVSERQGSVREVGNTPADTNLDLFKSILSNWSEGVFVTELNRTGIKLEDIVPFDQSVTVRLGNWFADSYNYLMSIGGTELFRVGNETAGTLYPSAIIDTQNANMKIESYVSPGGLKTHSHMLDDTPATNPTTDFTYGNTNSTGIKYGLPRASNSIFVEFDQDDLFLELTPADFVFNTVVKPVPTVELSPNKIVPLATPFHKVKYIIKAY
jgi:hypothetical protein